jgi:ribosomal protein S27AE
MTVTRAELLGIELEDMSRVGNRDRRPCPSCGHDDVLTGLVRAAVGTRYQPPEWGVVLLEDCPECGAGAGESY